MVTEYPGSVSGPKYNIINLNCDWGMSWTPVQAESELAGFKFRGPGFYKSPNNKGSILVVPLDRPLGEGFWAPEFRTDERFRFSFYNAIDLVTEITQLMIQAPRN